MPIKLKISAFLIVAMALLTSLAGCIDYQYSPEVYLMEKMTNTYEGIETLRFDMQTSITFSNEEFETNDVTTMTDANYIIDMTSMEMQIKMRMAAIGNDAIQGNSEAEIDMYLLDGAMYLKMPGAGMPAEWIKMEMPEALQEQNFKEFADQAMAYNLQPELIEASGMSIIGEENVNGTDCHVISYTLNKDFWQITAEDPALMQQFGGEFDLSEVTIQDSQITQWVAKDTFYLIKQSLQMTHIENSTFFGITEPWEESFEMKQISNITVDYHSHNEPVSIELPPEAENAMDMTDMMMMEPEL